MAGMSTRKIRLFRNGDENFVGKTLVLNPRQIRSFDCLLETATSHVGLGQAVRSIRTPRHGTIVRSLDDLEDQQDYVAVGIGRFRSIGCVLCFLFVIRFIVLFNSIISSLVLALSLYSALLLSFSLFSLR